MSLPKFFSIYKSHGFKFYKNSIMFPSSNSYNPVNVVTPLINTSSRMVSKYTSTQNELDGVLSRETLTRMYSFKYKFTGVEVSIMLDGSNLIVPGISFLECDHSILPRGSPVIIPPTDQVHPQARARSRFYLDADLVFLDTENNLQPIVSPQSLPEPITRSTLYPAHIINIIIADSIQRNECCVITSDIISHENACITSCGHVFTRSGLTEWFASSSNHICPICRQECKI